MPVKHTPEAREGGVAVGEGRWSPPRSCLPTSNTGSCARRSHLRSHAPPAAATHTYLSPVEPAYQLKWAQWMQQSQGEARKLDSVLTLCLMQESKHFHICQNEQEVTGGSGCFQPTHMQINLYAYAAHILKQNTPAQSTRTARKYDSAHSARRVSFASAMPVSVM